MTPPVEQWIEYQQGRFENSMSQVVDEDEYIEFNGSFIISKSAALKILHLHDALKYLKDEIYFRQVQLMEKYCTCMK